MMAGLGEDGTHIWEKLVEPQEETAQLISSSKEETDVPTAVGIRGGASASDFTRGHNQPEFGLGGSRTAVMPDEPTHWHPTPCVAKTSTKGENSVLVHGHFPLHSYSPAHACVTGAPVQDGRTRSTNEHCELPQQATTDRVMLDHLGISQALTTEPSSEGKIPKPCSDWHHQGSSALVPGQYMPLYKPLSQAGVTSAPPVQNDTIDSPPLNQNNPAAQYPVVNNVPTANGTGHEWVCTNTEKAGDGKYIMKSVDNFKELQDVVHCCTQVSKIPWNVGKLIKLTDKDRSAFVNRFKQKQKPKIMWSSIKPTIPCTGVPFAKAKPPRITIWCPSFNCSACITVQLIWTFPNMFRQMRAAPLRRSESRAGMDGMCDRHWAVPLNTKRVFADVCSGEIIPVAQYHINLPTRQAHTCLQNRPTHSAMPLSVLGTANGEYMMDQPIYGTMQHNPHMQPGPGVAVNAAGTPGRVGMNPGVYHTAGAGQYSTNVPQQYPANHSSHPQISAPMYRSTDMYGRPMVPSSSPGNMSGAQAEGGATVGGEAGQSPPPREHWQSSVRQDVRDHLIKKILNGIYPVNDYNTAMTNPQYSKLVQFIQRVEDTFFRTCTSKDEYFAKLAAGRQVPALNEGTPQNLPSS